MSTQIIDYKKVRCPKCGKSYFRVKDDSAFTTLPFIFKPAPIYKDGKLQNPTETESIKVRCECLECKCNFRVEAHDVFGEYRFIDEDEERRRLAESFKVLKKEPKKAKTELVTCNLKITEPQLDVEPVSDKFTKIWQDKFEKELDEIKERLAKLESK